MQNYTKHWIFINFLSTEKAFNEIVYEGKDINKKKKTVFKNIITVLKSENLFNEEKAKNKKSKVLRS